MLLLTDSITLTAHDAISLTDATTTANLVTDGNLRSSVSVPSLSPIFDIDFGPDKKAVADAVFIKGSNLNDYTVSVSDDNDNPNYTVLGSTYTVPANGHSFERFTNTTSYRRWRVSFSARGSSDPLYRIHEIYLMQVLLDMDTDEDRPLRIRAVRNRGIFFRAATGDLLWFDPTGFSQGQTTINLEWDALSNNMVERLKSVWQNRLLFDKLLTVYPRPSVEPKNIYYVRWQNDFEFRYSGTRIEHGQSGTVVLREVILQNEGQ